MSEYKKKKSMSIRQQIREELLRRLLLKGVVCVTQIAKTLSTEHVSINKEEIEGAITELVEGFFDINVYYQCGIICIVDRSGLILYGSTSFMVCYIVFFFCLPTKLNYLIERTIFFIFKLYFSMFSPNNSHGMSIKTCESQ